MPSPSHPSEITRDRLKRIAEQEAERREAGALAERLPLPAMKHVRPMTKDRRRGRTFAAYRSDVFDLLQGRRTLTSAHVAAARRLQADVAARAGQCRTEGNASGVKPEFSPYRTGVQPSMVEAGKRVDAILKGCGPSVAKLLRRLVVEPIERAELVADEWRAIVQSATAVKDLGAQSILVRVACDDLVESYRSWDAQPVQRAA